MNDNLSFQIIYRKANEIFSLINAAGIAIHKQSRFSRFKDQLQKEIEEPINNELEFNGTSYSKPLDFEKIFRRASTLGQGLRDFVELWAIVSSKSILYNNRNEVRQIFGGNVDQFEDKLSNTKARDLQYQLFVTSVIELSGYEVECAEPDFRFILSNEQYSVACKRINSANKLHKRIKEAEKQIEMSNRKGFIALSLDKLVGLNFFSGTTDVNRLIQDAREMIYGLLTRSYPDRMPELKECVLGIILSLSYIGMDIVTDELNFAHAFEVLIYDRGNEEMNNKLMDFARSLKLSAKNLK